MRTTPSRVALLLPLPLGLWLAFADHDTPPAEPLPPNPEARVLAQRAFELVEHQLRAATTQAATSWASQPGGIRTFNEDGSMSRIYKLYSAPDLLAASTAEAMADLPANWDQQPTRFVDLNAPVTTGGQLSFPIADPRVAPEGFSYQNTINGVVPLRGGHDDTGARLPMPVGWIYLLQDGTRGYLDTANRFIGPKLATDGNPIVGRIAFWSDDNTAKINLNTASEGVFWDMPRTDTVEDRGLAASQPAAGEYQRLPGHPATVCLSSVLFPNQRIGTPEGGSGSMAALPIGDAELLWWIGNGVGRSGSKAGTVAIEDMELATAYPRDYSPYLRLDDVFERRRMASISDDDPVLEERLERSGFFLTTESNAPELTLRGYPRVSVWPRDDNRLQPEPDYSPMASPGGRHYGFSRRNWSSRHNEFYNIASGRNSNLFDYLNHHSARPIPGFGGSLADKYGSGSFSDRAQVIAMVFDHIRGINLAEKVSPGSEFSPRGQVSSLCLCGGTSPHRSRWDRPEFPDPFAGGRTFTVSEVALVFYCSGWDDGLGNRGGDTAGLDAGQKRIAVGLIVETFCPAHGFAYIAPELGLSLSGETSSGFGTTPPEMKLDGQSIGSPTTSFLATETGIRDQGTPGGHGGADLVLRASDGSGISWEDGAIVDLAATSVTFEGNADEMQLIIYDTDDRGLANINNAVQVLKLKFPDTLLPPPGIPIDEPIDWRTRLTAVREGRDELIRPRDVVRSLVVGHGDYRLIAATRATSEEDFQPHDSYDRPNVRLAHSLLLADGTQAPGASFEAELIPRSNVPDDLRPDTPLAPTNPRYAPRRPPGYAFPIDPAVTGDFDNGFGNTRDGPYLNRPDEGVYLASGPTHYFNSRAGVLEPLVSRLVFSPHRIMPGPVMFGSIPSGVRAGIPWRTLLFRPDSQHFGASETPDHLWLDLFRMPAPLPFRNGGSSQFSGDWKGDGFSTDGKINLNYQILPFAHVRRATALHAALKAEKMMAIPTSDGDLYKSPGGPTSYRHFIDARLTLQQWDAKFASGDVFRSASQICEMFLVPEQEVPGGASRMREFWDNHQLTGDNTKERPYAALYQHFTTQSNSYQVHVIAQTIEKSDSVPADIFDPSQDEVREEYRGSGTLVRWIDADDPRLPDFLDVRLADSLSGRYEYALTGVRPPLERFEITNIDLNADGDVSVFWASTPQESYVVQRSTDLRDWSDIATVQSTGQLTLYVDRSVPVGVERMFYRVVN